MSYAKIFSGNLVNFNTYFIKHKKQTRLNEGRVELHYLFLPCKLRRDSCLRRQRNPVRIRRNPLPKFFFARFVVLALPFEAPPSRLNHKAFCITSFPKFSRFSFRANLSAEKYVRRSFVWRTRRRLRRNSQTIGGFYRCFSKLF